MSDERDDQEPTDRGDDAGEDASPDPPEEEKGGLGLTEEFARIESEIQAEVGGSPPEAERDEPNEPDEGAPEPDGEDVPREVRFDETDSSEWVVPAAASGETGEWAVAGEFEGDAEDAPEVDPAGGETDPPDEPSDGEVEEEAEPAEEEPEEEEPQAEEPQDAQPGGERPEDEEPEDEEPDVTPPAPVDAPATEHTVVRPRPLVPPRSPASVGMGAGSSLPPAAVAAGVDGPKTPALWWRFLTGSVLIVLSVATSIAVSFLLFLGEVAADLQPIPEVQGVLDNLEPGDPQTILILGSDKRSNTPGDPGRSDTTMLLRVDGEDGVLSLFSLPRDLKVEIPGYGVGKLNEAYTVGGVKKTTKTVKDLLGIEIHHVVNVDFQGFADAVSAIDCVYVDVDRDYFNDNAGLYGDQTYAAIDVNAGYQRLCGQNALDYVRYRHTDTDIVRAARQQDFLSQARRQVPAGEIIPIFGGDLGSDLIDIFTDYTSSDIRSTDQVIGTLKEFLAVRNVPIKRVSFEGTLEESFVTATPEQIDTAVQEFLGGEDTEGPLGGDEANETPKDKIEREGKNKGSGDEKKDPTEGSSVISTDDTVAPCAEVTNKFTSFGRTSARRLKFPVYVPTAVVPGSCYSDDSRQYDIKDPDDDRNSAYKMVIEYTTPSTLPEYYGVQGTTWGDPPILEDPSDTIEIGDRSYDLYYDGDRLARIAWHDEENNSYWLSNTLLGTLDESDMLAIAKSMDEAHS